MATRIPAPDRTPFGPAYEGRVLPRPDDEVVDQGAGFDLRTLLSRRAVFSVLGLGAGAAVLAACAPAESAPATSTGAPADRTNPAEASGTPTEEVPDETAGPYPGDGSNGPDALTESGIVRRDIRADLDGTDPVDDVPLAITLRITDMANGDAPFAGVAVYVWHCDGLGRYSMYSEGVEDRTWLRGVQIADADGKVTFTSVVPGCYAGRWPHVHFEVYPDESTIDDAANAIATSQLALPESTLKPVYEGSGYDGSAQNLSQVTIASDGIFGDDGGALQIAAVTGDVVAGFTATLTVRVDTATEPTGGGMGGGPGGPGGGEPPRG